MVHFTQYSCSITLAVVAFMLTCYIEASVVSKVGYKKPSFSKDKYQKHKIELTKTNAAATSLTKSSENDLNQKSSIITAPHQQPTKNIESTTSIAMTFTTKDDQKLDSDFTETTAINIEDLGSTISSDDTSSSLMLATTLAAADSTDIDVPEPVPCTCGIFLSSQFKKGSQDTPRGEAVISNSLDRTYACDGVGQKQCQTKCLEQIVKHLPNSAKILCASLDRDIRKERAYLFIKNCNNKWMNTNLAAGREYCCKNGEPYSCK